jgi:HK97 family phage portal protein
MILRSRGNDVRVFDPSVGQLLAQRERGLGGSYVAVNGRSVSGLPAAARAITIAAEAVAKRRMRVWTGENADKREVTTTWQARLFRGVPNERESWFDVFEKTEASLTGRNSAFWLKAKDEVNRVVSVYFVGRDRIEARWNRQTNEPEYRIRSVDGNGWTDWLGPDVVLHFNVGSVEPDCLIAPTPIEQFRDVLKAALSKVRFEGNHYEEGIMNSLAVVFPEGVTPEKAREYREAMRDEHGGIENSAGVRAFGGGVTLHEIGISLADAQFIESMNFDAQQLARIYKITASLLDVGAGGSQRTQLTAELEEDRWYRFGLEPRLTRIEERLKSDPDFFGSSARAYPAFAFAPIRADVATESDRLVHEVQAGIKLPDEARAELGLPPLPNGAGQIPQITPVGGAPNDVVPAAD